MVWPLGASSETVKTASTVPAFPSVMVTSSMDRLGGRSSSRMVAWPWLSAMVTLAGLLPNEAERHMAECDAWYVFGVDKVINNIEVRPS